MMMKAGQTENIQNEVWRDVDSLSAKFSAFSPTADFTNIIKEQRFSEESKIIDFIQNTDAIGYAVSAGKSFLQRCFLIRTYAEDKAPNLLSPGSLILNLRFVKKSIVRQM